MWWELPAVTLGLAALVIALALPPDAGQPSALVLSFAGCAALLAFTRVCQANALTRHWLGFGLGGVATFVHIGNTMPEHMPTAVGVLAAALYFGGGLAMSLRIHRASTPTRAGQLTLLWCCPIVGFLILSAYYRHIDEPRVDDEYQHYFAEANGEIGCGDFGGKGPILPITRSRRWAVGRRRH